MRITIIGFILPLFLTGYLTWHKDAETVLLSVAKTHGDASKLTKQERSRLNRYYPQTLTRIDDEKKLTIQDIIRLTMAGIPDEKIITLIRNTESIFYLSNADVQELSEMGVSNRVIQSMKETDHLTYAAKKTK